MSSSPKTCWRSLRELGATLTRLRARGELGLCVRIGLIAPLVVPIMRLPLARVDRFFTAALGAPSGSAAIEPARLAQLVERAQVRAHPLVRRGCLTRGISLLWLLRRAGLDVSLVFGIGGAQDRDQGHCWLVRDGEPFLEAHPVDGRFVEMYRIPALAS